MSEGKDNMKLWNSVCETDPKHTNQVNIGRRFTAIDAQYQIRTATEKWGPYGSKWGVKDCRFSSVGEDGKIPVEIALHAKFFYPDGEFEISSDIAYKPGKDTCKKLMTDLTTKALSKLGFNADVFERRYDDNKYVQEMQQKFSGDSRPKASEPMTDKESLTTDKLIEDIRIMAANEHGDKTDEYVAEVLGKAKVKSIEELSMDRLQQWHQALIESAV